MLNETRERFLKTILERVPIEKIVEIHLFPEIRAGQMETGVAVVAFAEEFPNPHPGRHEVLTAWYRLTRKGPDRGKWEVEVKTTADAPLPTVETVVRGVQQRTGDGVEPLKLNAAELQALIAEPSWQTAP